MSHEIQGKQLAIQFLEKNMQALETQASQGNYSRSRTTEIGEIARLLSREDFVKRAEKLLQETFVATFRHNNTIQPLAELENEYMLYDESKVLQSIQLAAKDDAVPLALKETKTKRW